MSHHNGAACRGSYVIPIRVNPTTGAGECPVCGRRFDLRDLTASEVRKIPMHTDSRGPQP